ncbi:hypothetical protein B0H12DRAFT_782321 [Mycena haematopus]|nr:hypothetical protein B0H12DRAFT_782321 [Mycena haematopus]
MPDARCTSLLDTLLREFIYPLNLFVLRDGDGGAPWHRRGRAAPPRGGSGRTSRLPGPETRPSVLPLRSPVTYPYSLCTSSFQNPSLRASLFASACRCRVWVLHHLHLQKASPGIIADTEFHSSGMSVAVAVGACIYRKRLPTPEVRPALFCERQYPPCAREQIRTSGISFLKIRIHYGLDLL